MPGISQPQNTPSKTLVLQWIVAIALGYEDLNDHDTLRHDPLMAVLAGQLAARRYDCAALAERAP
jgi:Transposase DDE domain group 1